LLRQIDALKGLAEQVVADQEARGAIGGLGLQIQFVSQPNVELAFESLAYAPQKIELLSVRRDGDTSIASVFVPDGKLAHFEKYIREYLEEKKDIRGFARDHKPLLDTIQSIRAAEIQALWTDDPSLLPRDLEQRFWWEVWLPARDDPENVLFDFRRFAAEAGCVISDEQVKFPERTVLLMYGSQAQLSTSVMTLNCVAELRRAKETAEFFDGMEIPEQREWMQDMLRRLQVVAGSEDALSICILDSGVNRGHPLLRPLMDEEDMHSVDPAWGTNDIANHGTGLAGISAFGDLTNHLESDFAIEINHRLESVKLTPAEGANQGNAEHHAFLFAEAVSRPEVSAPHRHRVFTSAVSASDYRDRGRPSSWSSMVDKLASDADNAGEFPRLFVIAAGNTRSYDAWATYPESLSTNLIHDPGQSWNALTVGACSVDVAMMTRTRPRSMTTLSLRASSGGSWP
jgi:hypothetical protein